MKVSKIINKVLIENTALVIDPILGIKFDEHGNINFFLIVSLFHQKLLFVESMIVENEVIKDENILVVTHELSDEYKTKNEGRVYQTSERVIFYIQEKQIMTSSLLYRNLRRDFYKLKENICIHKDVKITNSIISIHNGIIQMFGNTALVKYGYLINKTKLTKILKPRLIKKATPFFTELSCSIFKKDRKIFPSDYALVEKVVINDFQFFFLRPALNYQFQEIIPYKIVSSQNETVVINFVIQFTSTIFHGERIVHKKFLFTGFKVVIVMNQTLEEEIVESYDTEVLNNFTIKFLPLNKSQIPSKPNNVVLKKNQVKIEPTSSIDYYKIGFVSIETVETTTKIFDIESIKNSEGDIINNVWTRPNFYVPAHSTLVSIDVQMTKLGIINSIINQIGDIYEMEILTVEELPCIVYDVCKEQVNVKEGDLIKSGAKLTSNIFTSNAGQIYQIDRNRIYIRIGVLQYLDNQSTQNVAIQVPRLQFLQKGTLLGYNYVYQGRTSDIALGIKDVARVLEIRKDPVSYGTVSPILGILFWNEYQLSFGIVTIRHNFYQIYEQNTKQKMDQQLFPISLNSTSTSHLSTGQCVYVLDWLISGFIHVRDELKILYNFYSAEKNANNINRLTNRKVRGVSYASACEKSLKHVRIRLVTDIQNEYLKYDVNISLKHIEIIVRRLTSKLVVVDAGTTELLPGEYIEQLQMQAIEIAIFKKRDQPLYEPVVLGLTKISLNNRSFLSAASFQQAVNVLTAAAIRGRKDWFLGLKENVISGRMIPHPSDPLFLKKYAKVLSNNISTLITKKIKEDEHIRKS